MSDRTLVLLAVLLALAGCNTWPNAIALPGGPSRGSMTYDEAMGARTGLTRLDRLPPAETATPPR